MTLENLLAEPAAAAGVDQAEVARLLSELEALQSSVTALRTLLLTRLTVPNKPVGDRLLSVKEAADRMGVSTKWLYQRVDKLPFARRLDGVIRVSEQGLEKWLHIAK